MKAFQYLVCAKKNLQFEATAMKVIVFGAGKENQKDIDNIRKLCNVIYLMDLDLSKCNKWLNGIKVLPPSEIGDIEYDRIVIVDDTREIEIRNKLLELGVPKERIYEKNYFYMELRRGERYVYGHRDKPEMHGKKILIISTHLNYNGGTMAAIYALNVLKKRGYDVSIAADFGDKRLINELCEEGNEVIICPALFTSITDVEMEWIGAFDAVIVNTFQMMAIACQISRVKPVIWWIHEGSVPEVDDVYPPSIDKYWNMDFESDFNNISIYAVSRIARSCLISIILM
jgi:hypothetical protein